MRTKRRSGLSRTGFGVGSQRLTVLPEDVPLNQHDDLNCMAVLVKTYTRYDGSHSSRRTGQEITALSCLECNRIHHKARQDQVPKEELHRRAHPARPHETPALVRAIQHVKDNPDDEKGWKYREDCASTIIGQLVKMKSDKGAAMRLIAQKGLKVKSEGGMIVNALNLLLTDPLPHAAP